MSEIELQLVSLAKLVARLQCEIDYLKESYEEELSHKEWYKEKHAQIVKEIDKHFHASDSFKADDELYKAVGLLP